MFIIKGGINIMKLFKSCERQQTITQLKQRLEEKDEQLKRQDIKWQKLKEFISNRSACAGYVVQVRLIWDILEKMQELEGEDE